MLIIPAIDLKDGKVVRYTKGRLNKKIYSSDPVDVAFEWKRQGAKILHIVDLDGALYGKQKNFWCIKKIASEVKIPIQIGGGIRNLKTIQKVAKLGVKRIIIGTKAIENPDFLKAAIKIFGNKIALGLDSSGMRIGLYGWRKSCNVQLKTLLKKLEDMHLKTIIYTDISRDGTLKGINICNIKKMLQSTSIDLIASGGVSSLKDIKKLLKIKSNNLKGVIVGKALYEKRFTLNEAASIEPN